MKTITLTLYEFDELSKDVQKEIIERERWNVMEQCMDCYGTEYKASLEEFEKLTGTKAKNWHVDYSGYSMGFLCSSKPIYENPKDYDKDIYAENLCGKLLFRHINNDIMPCITKGKCFQTSGKYIDGRYHYKHKYSHVIREYDDNCPLTGTCYDYYLLKPIIDYYKNWCSYPSNFSWKNLMEHCYKSFFSIWHKEYEYWADNEDAIREELHHNQYENRLYFLDGAVYGGPLEQVA